LTWRHFKLGLASDEELGLRPTPLSGVFSIEKASADRKGLQQAVDRIVAIIQASPDKERIDNIITRWLKRYLQRLGAKANLDQLTSLMEDKDMLAENLENWAQQERQAGIEKGTKLGIEQGKKLGIEQGTKLGIEKTARNLLKLGVLSNDQIAEVTGLDLEDIAKLQTELQR
jgi:flagellar biosynthesis/type III secretory pathway protein FliH